VQDAADHPSIVDTLFAAHVARQMRLDPSPLLTAQPKQVAPHLLRSLSAQNHQAILSSTDLLGFDPGRREHRSHQDQGKEPANQRHRRAISQDMLDEFYRIAFRKKIYQTISDLQADLGTSMVENKNSVPTRADTARQSTTSNLP
jgi:hypothetical protein